MAPNFQLYYTLSTLSLMDVDVDGFFSFPPFFGCVKNYSILGTGTIVAVDNRLTQAAFESNNRSSV